MWGYTIWLIEGDAEIRSPLFMYSVISVFVINQCVFISSTVGLPLSLWCEIMLIDCSRGEALIRSPLFTCFLKSAISHRILHLSYQVSHFGVYWWSIVRSFCVRNGSCCVCWWNASFMLKVFVVILLVRVQIFHSPAFWQEIIVFLLGIVPILFCSWDIPFFTARNVIIVFYCVQNCHEYIYS